MIIPTNGEVSFKGGNRRPVCIRITTSLSNRKYAPQSENAIHQQSTRQLPNTTPPDACIIITVDAAPARPSLPLQYAKVEHPSRGLQHLVLWLRFRDPENSTTFLLEEARTP